MKQIGQDVFAQCATSVTVRPVSANHDSSSWEPNKVRSSDVFVVGAVVTRFIVFMSITYQRGMTEMIREGRRAPILATSIRSRRSIRV